MPLAGSCLCGAVTFTLTGPLKPVVTCHCTMCRKHTGHFLATADAWKDQMEITRTDGLAWYRSSETARRGFCKKCGSTLFFDVDGDDKISVSAGAIDGATGLQLAANIYVADKGDYYEIAQGTCHDAGNHGIAMPPRNAANGS